MARTGKTLRTPVGTSALMRLEEDVLEMGVNMGLFIFKGMFKAHEVGTVDSIIEDETILVALQEEARQREYEERQAALYNG